MPGAAGALGRVIEGLQATQQPAQRAQAAGGHDRRPALLRRDRRDVRGDEQWLGLELGDGVIGGQALRRIVLLREPPENLGVAVDAVARPHRREEARDPAVAVGAVDPIDAEVELDDLGDADAVDVAEMRRQLRDPAAGGGAQPRTVDPGAHRGAGRAPVNPNSRPAIRRSWSSSEPSVMR